MAARSSNTPVSFDNDNADLALVYARRNGPQFDHGRQLVHSLCLREGESVLDLGAGTGELTHLAAELVGASGSVVALEPLVNRVRLARSEARPNTRVEVGGSDDLHSYPSESFDVIFLNSVFHWIGDQPRLLLNLMRLLRAGGRLGISSGIANKPHQQVKLLSPILATQGGCKPGGYLSPPHVTTPELLKQNLDSAGFRFTDIKEHTFIDHFTDLEALIEWNASSFFGNFIAGVSREETPEIWDNTERLLNSYRDEEGIRLERYLLLATAVK